MSKKVTHTESIEVPIEIASEVKLFISLLKTGEINSLSELLSLAGLGQAKLFSSIDLPTLWLQILDRITPGMTQALFRQQARLLDFNGSEATVGISSTSLLKMNRQKIPHIEKAMNEVIGTAVKVKLVVANDDDITKNKPTTQPKQEHRLTPDQETALKKLKSFSQSQDKFFRLTGYAGTGKSFLMCHYIKWLMKESISFVAATPTNKAAKSLKKLAAEENLSIEVKTVAQLLGQQPELNEQTGIEEFICNGEADLSSYSIVIIDEFSMVNRDNFSEIVNAASSSLLTKIVFVGDGSQLPPVKEKEPIVATSPLIERDATLTSVVRYDGHIARVAEEIRSNPKYRRIIYPFSSSSDKTILCLPQEQWRERAIAFFDSQEYKHNSDHIRFLAWRNQTVQSLNLFVRSRLWGEDAPPYVSGDILIARKPLFRTKAGAKGQNKWRILINNSEECRVTDGGELSELLFQNQIYRYWQVTVEPENGKPQTLSILAAESEELYTQQVKHFANKKQWNRYFDLSRMFDDVGYAYALTTHKAQGSTIDYVFLDVDDMTRCSDRALLLYTALTRAKKQVLISQ